jgi:hypothetical protein
VPRAEIEGAFPQLHSLNYFLTSDPSPFYNCAAWAVGSTSVPWWPFDGGGYYWPPGFVRVDEVGTFVATYRSMGYDVCPDGNHEAGFQKIAIYARDSRPKHVARELPSGRWSSKLGDWEDIEHLSPALLQGDRYGTVAIFMRRPIADPSANPSV